MAFSAFRRDRHAACYTRPLEFEQNSRPNFACRHLWSKFKNFDFIFTLAALRHQGAENAKPLSLFLRAALAVTFFFNAVRLKRLDLFNHHPWLTVTHIMIWNNRSATFFKMMGLLWFFPSIGALVILLTASQDSRWGLERTLAFLIITFHIYLGYRWLSAPKDA